MKEIKVRISNDSLNSYGTRILTDGMDISQFERNPVLLYMHQRGTVVGQVKTIVKGKNEVTGVLVFDEATELSKQLKKQYEEGSMRMVSVGVSVLEWSEAPEHLVQGQTSPTVSKSKLLEVSCVDVGANDDALRLFCDGEILTLAQGAKNSLPILTKQNNKMEIKQLALMLGLPETATAEQVKAKIGQLLEMAKEFETLKKEKEQLVLSAITSAVDGAVKERRVSAENKAHFIELGKKIGLDELNVTLKAMNPAVKLSNQLTASSGKVYKKLSDVPEAELKAMKENDPAQYAALYKAEYGMDLEN